MDLHNYKSLAVIESYQDYHKDRGVTSTVLFLRTEHRGGRRNQCQQHCWAVRPNEPSGFRGRKAILTMLRHWSQLVPNMSTDICMRTLSNTTYLLELS